MKKILRKLNKKAKALAPKAKALALKAAALFHRFHTYLILAYVILINGKLDDLSARLDAALTAIGGTMVLLLLNTASLLGQMAGELEQLLHYVKPAI